MENKELEYATEIRKNRRKDGIKTQEFFTPSNIVKELCDKIPIEKWKNIHANFVEPCFGNGNIILEIIKRKMQYGSTYVQALEHTYGIELMQDNVIECHNRIFELLDTLNINYDKNIAQSIINKNLVCADFFNWDFENWKPKC